MSKRKIWREGDENVCTLGFRWGVDEPDPHFDSVVYELQRKLISASQEGEKPIVDYLAALVGRCLLSEDNDAAHVNGIEFIQRVDKEALKHDI